MYSPRLIKLPKKDIKTNFELLFSGLEAGIPAVDERWANNRPVTSTRVRLFAICEIQVGDETGFPILRDDPHLCILSPTEGGYTVDSPAFQPDFGQKTNYSNVRSRKLV